MSPYKRMGDFLLEKGVITKKQLAKAVKMKTTSKLRFGQILVMIGAASEQDIVDCLADQFDYPIVNLEMLEPQPEAIAALDRETAVSHLILPMKIDETTLDCVVADPLDFDFTDVLTNRLGRRLNIALATQTQLTKAIEAAYDCKIGGLLDSKEPLTQPEPVTPKKRRSKVQQQWDRDAIISLAAAIPQAPQKAKISKWFSPAKERSA